MQNTTKELGKRRVFIFLSVLIVIALGLTLAEESDIPLHSIDDIVIIALSLIILVVIYVSRKKISFNELRKQHNIVLVLLIIMLIFQIFGIIVERNDTVDFGNEIPSLILIILLIINRFV